MRFQTPLVPARLIRRYKRFLADVQLEDGSEVVAHCANPGSMLGLAEPGMRIWLEPNDDPKKKLGYGWRLIELEGAFVGVDTSLPNRLLRGALEVGAVPGLNAYPQVLREQKYGQKSRVDFLLRGEGLPDAYVEVKSVTLSRQTGLAEFPDSVTTRGARHLDDLAKMVQQGHRAVMLYLVQRTDCTSVTLAADLDPAYAASFAAARATGIEVLCHGCDITPEAVILGAPLPFHMG
ncbi:DNA/RNA nuclease SfsA [Puniceibacterium sp. IMCC21224]|uniref:DNA/RNA nuclease SfsA n=1 Tax=Puniceibacterium sp. IMCC21224 TaxID=1618204 RepID=UPI00064DAB2D|nr:DNA/RNA nuclease SfsA [Puniceibacterium sp. IMCC21224]KMK65342.1 sugar fermentation stimulation protein [Puniceibacterium sp. IMCC21224]